MIDIAELTTALKAIDELRKPSQGIVTSLKKGVQDFTNKSAIDLGFAFDAYLEKSCEKIKKVKTFLYKRTPKDLTDIYVCTGVRYKDIEISENLVESMVNIGHKLIITGTAGIGKTTMLKSIFLTTSEKLSCVPVFIELRNMDDDTRLYDMIYNSLSNQGVHFIEEKHFEYSMNNGCYLLLFDGFDELSTEKAKKIEREIQVIAEKYSENYYILTSRPLSIFSGWGDFIEMQALPLKKEQAIELIEKLDYDLSDKEAFIKILKERLYDSHYSFASNPLLLTIMFITYTDRGNYIPDELNTFYEEAFAALFELHDNTKGSYRRDIATGLNREEFKKIFSYLCFKTFFDNKQALTDAELRIYLERAKEKIPEITFSIDLMIRDLTVSVCMLVQDGRYYSFVHKSFQEYFAAVYTTSLTDAIQNEVIKDCFKRCIHRPEEMYFKMLFELQPTKMDDYIIRKNLRSLGKIYNDAFDINFLRYFSKGIRATVGNSNRKDKYYISLDVYKNRLILFDMIKLGCILHGYSFEEENVNDNAFEDYITSKFPKLGNGDGVSLSYKDIINDSMEGLLLKQLFWFRDRTEFILKYLENHKSHYKRNINIIDEL